MKRYFLSIFLTMLTGCATHLSQQQCLTTNWQELGFRDGSSGSEPKNLEQSTQDCTSYGVKIDRNQYQSGWKQGVQKFCTPNSDLGFADAQAGKPLSDINSRIPICTQADIVLNLSTYKIGHQKGLALYCNYENGAIRAREGKSLPLGLCATHNPKQFNAGYMEGSLQLCGLPQNGFALGKDNKPYPDSCSPEQYPVFHAEYDRGHEISQRLADLKDRKSNADLVDSLLDLSTIKYGFKTMPDGYYALGNDTSDSAKKALETLNTHVRKEHHMDQEISRVQSQY